MTKKTPKMNLLKKWQAKKKLPVDELEKVNCENCGYEFKGHFCPNCGQEIAEFNRPIGFVLYDFMGNFFAFDTRFFNSFWKLLSRPGFLTEEFFKGRRVSYSPPFRIFVFLSFVLFLLLQILSERGLNRSIRVNVDEDKIVAVGDSVVNQLSDSIVTEGLLELKGERDRSIDFSDLNGRSINEVLANFAVSLEEELKTTTDKEEREEIKSFIFLCRNPEVVVTKFLKYLSWSFFILLPVFALLLKLFYLKRRQYFIRHLIFSIHLHSFMFFMLIIAIILGYIFESIVGYVVLIGFLAVPVYFLLALKRFYGQSLGKVFLKFFGISFIYNCILLSVVLYTFLDALGVISLL